MPVKHRWPPYPTYRAPVVPGPLISRHSAGIVVVLLALFLIGPGAAAGKLLPTVAFKPRPPQMPLIQSGDCVVIDTGDFERRDEAGGPTAASEEYASVAR